MNGKNKNLIIAGVIVLVVAVAGYLYAGRDRTDDILLSSTEAGVVTPVDDTFLSSLRTLRKLKLDDSIFSTAVWSSLIDFGRDLVKQPAGRTNPFSPIESGSTVSTPAATTTAR